MKQNPTILIRAETLLDSSNLTCGPHLFQANPTPEWLKASWSMHWANKGGRRGTRTCCCGIRAWNQGEEWKWPWRCPLPKADLERNDFWTDFQPFQHTHTCVYARPPPPTHTLPFLLQADLRLNILLFYLSGSPFLPLQCNRDKVHII